MSKSHKQLTIRMNNQDFLKLEEFSKESRLSKTAIVHAGLELLYKNHNNNTFERLSVLEEKVNTFLENFGAISNELVEK